MIQDQLFAQSESGECASENGAYRYLLWRNWDERPPVVFVLLNPSTADADKDDPTVKRCRAWAARLGGGSLRIVNLFALRATDPGELYLAANPVGCNNDLALCEAVRDAKMVICGWGKHGAHLGRAGQVLTLLARQGVALHCLRANQDGSPAHPLYLPAHLQPVPYKHGSEYEH